MIQKFNFEGRAVRISDQNGGLWFVAVDVCGALGLDQVSRALSRLEKDEVTQITLADSMGRKQKTNIVSESGLYSLVITSEKPEAKAFKRWVTNEVLPTIRKTGKYEAIPKAFRDETKQARNTFTDTLKAHGYTAPHHYINTTKAMKAGLGIDNQKKKAEYNIRELGATMFAEILAQEKIGASDAHGYHSVKPIAVESAESVKLLLDQARLGAPLKVVAP